MKIGIIGVGTVGGGVLELLDKERKNIEKRVGEKIEISWICDLKESVNREQNYRFTKNYEDILKDESVETIIELIGGNSTAFHIAKETLKSGKNLITANKYLLATKGKEIFKLAKENGVKIFFEGAVAGGTPAVSSIYEGTFSGGIKKIRGILNGTSNYILSKMEEGYSYEKALSVAQSNGYAELDPTFDVKGIDTAHKISLLSYLVWGELIDFENIKIEGIDKITKEQVEAAKVLGKRFKLIGEAVKSKDGIKIYVKPSLVGEEDQLYGVKDVYNGIESYGEHLGEIFFYGKGAGALPTANAIIADLYKVKNSNAWN
ncbi:homoserine dehydrogenase [Cetobacterium sp.]|uniref:homoserine dehydrogenase n=1 Tax=Cetobacterium sp. TaxID=2071632 RepID=UPI003F32DE7A